MATLNLLPNAEGSVQTWSPFPAMTPGEPHWNKVDDPVGSPDEDATYVYTSTVGIEEAFNHVTSGLLSGANITNVRVLARVKHKPVGLPSSAQVNIGIRIGIIRFAQPISEVLTTIYVDYTGDWATKLPLSQPWTKADIDNLQSSLLSISATNTAIRCTQVYLIITYIPPVTPVAGKGLVSWTP